jgi:hypothetical protein
MILILGYPMCNWLPGQLLIDNMQGRVFEDIMNLLSSEEATNVKARRIALASNNYNQLHYNHSSFGT